MFFLTANAWLYSVDRLDGLRVWEVDGRAQPLNPPRLRPSTLGTEERASFGSWRLFRSKAVSSFLKILRTWDVQVHLVGRNNVDVAHAVVARLKVGSTPLVGLRGRWLGCPENARSVGCVWSRLALKGWERCDWWGPECPTKVHKVEPERWWNIVARYRIIVIIFDLWIWYEYAKRYAKQLASQLSREEQVIAILWNKVIAAATFLGQHAAQQKSRQQDHWMPVPLHGPFLAHVKKIHVTWWYRIKFGHSANVQPMFGHSKSFKVWSQQHFLPCISGTLKHWQLTSQLNLQAQSRHQAIWTVSAVESWELISVHFDQNNKQWMDRGAIFLKWLKTD